MSSTCLATGIV